MFGDKNLKDEVKALKGRLETLEHCEFGKKLEELQRADHEIEKEHQDSINKLREANHSLALKLSWLGGVAAFLFVISSGIAVYYFDLYKKEIEQSRENRPEVHEALVDIFQLKLGDTIDRISLLAPTREDKDMVKEVNDMRKKLGKVCESSEKFAALSKLTTALNQIVNERKAEEASKQLTADMLPNSEDRFVASRAQLLQAAARFYPAGLCDKPESVLELINNVIERDSGVVAAFSLRGVCLAAQAQNLLEGGPEAMANTPARWEESVKKIHDSLRDNEFAYHFKPSQWARIRFLNNRIWNSMQFLSAAVPLRKNMDEILRHIGRYKDIEDFFAEALDDIQECYLLTNDQATYLETEAELHGLEYTYYTSNDYKNEGKAKAAREGMFEKLKAAMDKDLLKARELSSLKAAEEYFQKDNLLKSLFADPKDIETIDPKFKDLIEQHLPRT